MTIISAIDGMSSPYLVPIKSVGRAGQLADPAGSFSVFNGNNPWESSHIVAEIRTFVSLKTIFYILLINNLLL